MRPLLLHLVILSTASIAAYITVSVLPASAADAPKIFTPSQWQAIDDKRVALEAAAVGSTNQVEGFRPQPFLAQSSEQPVFPNAGVGTRGPSVVYPTEMCEPKSDGTCAPLDVMNVFFGGVGSADDVAYDMTNPAYGDQFVPAEYYPGEPHVKWDERNCGTGTGFRALINGQSEPYSKDILSRQIYTPDPFIPTVCRRNPEGQIFHVRIWNGGLTSGPDGEWSIGAAHWDPDDHVTSNRFEEAEALVALTFMNGFNLNGTPRWFVGDVWIFYAGNPRPADCMTGSYSQPCSHRDGWITYIYLVA